MHEIDSILKALFLNSYIIRVDHPFVSFFLLSVDVIPDLVSSQSALARMEKLIKCTYTPGNFRSKRNREAFLFSTLAEFFADKNSNFTFRSRARRKLLSKKKKKEKTDKLISQMIREGTREASDR